MKWPHHPSASAPAELAASDDHALGAVIGALVGDAAGAVLEFLGRIPTADEVERAITMPGGGCWRVAPGQITDDGELTISLLRALVPGEPYEANRVAAAYVAWYRSHPFDIGGTTVAALSAWVPGKEDEEEDREGAADALQRAAEHRSMGSKANGSLMRATPLGVWGRTLNDDALAEAARMDSRLTHPNPSCADAVAAYSIAIAALVRSPGDREAAFDTARRWVQRAACEEVREWLILATTDEHVPFHPLAGFVKIGFIHAFRHLRAGSSYIDALQATLRGGGDTDTNACIVGGLIGAAEGFEAIPQAMREAVLECDTSRGRERPEWLHPGQVPALVRAL